MHVLMVGGNPRTYEENMQTPHRKVLPQPGRTQNSLDVTRAHLDLNTEPSCCEATVPNTKPPCCPLVCQIYVPEENWQKENIWHTVVTGRRRTSGTQWWKMYSDPLCLALASLQKPLLENYKPIMYKVYLRNYKI